MKKIVFTLMLLAAITVQSQTKDSVARATDTVKHWKSKGNFSALFNQSTFDNWVAGGENNISGTAGLNYDLNYNKSGWNWDNKFIASYGLVKTRTSSFAKKTDDRLEISSLLGHQMKAGSRWYYSAFMNFKTQFTKGYTYYRDENDAEQRDEFTQFFSPAYLSFGPGIMYKRDDNFKFNISPATSKLTFVDKNFTLPDDAYFGVEEGESVRYELGMNASVYYKLGIVANVSFENILNLYSNYLEDPQNVDIDYQLNIVMKINKYLATNINFQTIYDDNAFRGLQVRQVFGVSLNYMFGDTKK